MNILVGNHMSYNISKRLFRTLTLSTHMRKKTLYKKKKKNSMSTVTGFHQTLTEEKPHFYEVCSKEFSDNNALRKRTVSSQTRNFMTV